MDPLENDIQDFDNALEVEMESEDEDSNQSEEDKQDANNRWLDKDERHQLKEEEIVGHLHFSHVFSSTKHENVFRKLEVTFNQELYSIPFFEDHDIEVNSVNIGKDMCNLQETPSHHAHDELKIDFLALNPANSNDLDDSWCHLNYEFMNTLTDISRVSLEAMPRKGDSPLAAHLTIGISPRASLKPKLSMTRESMRFSNGQNLFQIEDIPLLYSPADIPLIEYMKCRPKDDKDKGLAGFFAHFIPDTLVEQAADKQGTANKDAKDDDPPSSKYFAEFKVEPLSSHRLT